MTGPRELLLIDLSSIAHPIWHMSQSHADPNHASQQVVARVRALAAQHPNAAICCDAGRSFRHEVAPSYKANRPESEAPLQHQITLAREQLAADGFPVWSVKGFEADDLIASAVTRTLADPDLFDHVLIVSADKDLLQLVGDRVRAMSARDGSIVDRDGVKTKFGVYPEQMRDYLMLVGDASDNVKGAQGIGAKRAAELLATFGSLEETYRRLQESPTSFKPAMATALKEFRERLAVTRDLITLRTDVDLPFDQIFRERVPVEQEAFAMEGDDMDTIDPVASAADVTVTGNPVPAPDAAPVAVEPGAVTQLVVREPSTPDVMPADYERQLDPRSMRDAQALAKDMYNSRMFSAYGTPQAVLSTIMVGRELGLPAMASLRCVHNIEGKHSLAASLMVALVLKSGMAEYFEPVSFSETEATFETKRKGARNPVRLTHTIEMAAKAGLVKDKSGWLKNPTDMLVARATARLARMVYPDLLAGLYTPEELHEIREQQAA